MKRYRCPNCDTGRNAPSRMSPDDVRRYCFPCSEKTGKLVALVCPSRERSMAKAKAARTERARRERAETIRRTYYLDDGTDTRMILRDVRKLHTWKREGPAAHRKVQGLLLKVDDVNRNVPWDQFAVFAMRKASVMLRHVAIKAGHVRRDQSNARVDGLLMDAACRYFGIAFPDIQAVAKSMARLKGRSEVLGSDWEAAILACARAAGAEPPVR